MHGDLPFATSADRPIAGRLKEAPDDFVVEEIPAYLPSGAGEHLYVRFEKRGLDTKEAVRRIARTLGVDPRAAGFAGLKDRHAITVQWASFHRGSASALEHAEIDGVQVLEARLHGNKLRTGHNRGNRFRIRIRGASAEREGDARAILDQLARTGAANYYGDQRFGRGGANLERARAWLVEGGEPPRDPFERKLLVSVLQSQLFNGLCADRVREGTLGTILDGDLCRKEDSGGLFVATDLEAERARAERFEISATGPMFGASMKWPEGEAKRREEAALAAAGLDLAALERFAKWGEGARRPYRIRPLRPEVVADEHGLVVAFDLPSGAYATVVLREVMRDAEEPTLSAS